MASNKCLLVIDVQFGMFNLSRPLFKSDAILENIISLIRRARAENTPVVFVQHCGGENSPFKKYSEGWNIHPAITPDVNDYILEKRHSDSFQDTGLGELLKKLGIGQIVVCGLVTEGCVDTTVRRAYSLGYKIELARDCHSTTDSNVLTGEQIVQHHNEVLKIFSEVKEAGDIKFNP
jgi:nicotinamidase-related amidase